LVDIGDFAWFASWLQECIDEHGQTQCTESLKLKEADDSPAGYHVWLTCESESHVTNNTIEKAAAFHKLISPSDGEFPLPEHERKEVDAILRRMLDAGRLTPE